MSDRIAVMHRGRVEQVAAAARRSTRRPRPLSWPASSATSISCSGRAAGANRVDCGSATSRPPAPRRRAPPWPSPSARSGSASTPPTPWTPCWPMTVAHVVYQGETVRYILKSDAGLELQAARAGRGPLRGRRARARGLGGRRRPDHPGRDRMTRQEETRMTKVGLDHGRAVPAQRRGAGHGGHPGRGRGDRWRRAPSTGSAARADRAPRPRGRRRDPRHPPRRRLVGLRGQEQDDLPHRGADRRPRGAGRGPQRAALHRRVPEARRAPALPRAAAAPARSPPRHGLSGSPRRAHAVGAPRAADHRALARLRLRRARGSRLALRRERPGGGAPRGRHAARRARPAWW